MEPIKFSDIKDELQKALTEKLKKVPIPGENMVTLIDGFISWPIQQELSNNFVIGGTNLPVIAVVGNDSGRIYTFALKAILPNIPIK